MRDEYERLKSRGGMKFAVARAGLKAAGRLSNGVDLGWRNGFDSGLSLDYVYKNQPHGTTSVGRLIDKSYLNRIGWRGIRQRRTHLEKSLKNAIERTHRNGRPVRILDIAAGPGRYVLETLRMCLEIPVSAILRDYKQENIDAARALAQEFGLDNVKVQRGDAFDRGSLASIEPRATIGIVSGLYELFSSNDAVLNRSEEHTSELHSRPHLVCRLLLEKKKQPRTIAGPFSVVAQMLGASIRPFPRWRAPAGPGLCV